MKPKNAKIDSFNFSSETLEDLFMNEDYIIEPVKGIGVFKPQRWLKEFGKSLTRNIVEAKILHTSNGLVLPLKRFAVTPQKQTLEFAGLYGYTSQSKLLKSLLNELYEHIQSELIVRIDVAIDFKGKIPKRVITALNKSRTSLKYRNTTYSKTAKEKKTNPHINICIYPKHLKDNLDDEVMRLEFSFRGAYFRGQYQVKHLDKAILKMQKTIKRFIELEVAIQPL